MNINHNKFLWLISFTWGRVYICRRNSGVDGFLFSPFKADHSKPEGVQNIIVGQDVTFLEVATRVFSWKDPYLISNRESMKRDRIQVFVFWGDRQVTFSDSSFVFVLIPKGGGIIRGFRR